MATKKANKKIAVAETKINKGDFFSNLVSKVNKKAVQPPEDWDLDRDEGQLSVDVGEKDGRLVIVATIAGARPEDISVNIHNDLLTIRGQRHREVDIDDKNYFYRECYWGNFSRTIVLPVDVLTDEAIGTFKNGVLTIVIPKESTKKKVPIKVLEE